ncbi:hypothetical protein [Sphingobacterium sp.]|nr:hypothetical protein [Sphingobacterium sp.]
MEWLQLMDLSEILSDSPVSMEEMLEFLGDDPDDRKCNIVFPF